MSQPAAQAQRQPILAHLNEARLRLTWALVGLALATGVSFFFAADLLQLLIAPYGEQLQTLSPTEGLETYFKVALAVGVALSMPWTLLQLWEFVAPALHPGERRLAFVFIPAATLLFLLGIAFAWFVLLPSAVRFLESFMPGLFAPNWTSREYISFATTFLLWIGLSFEMPLLIYLLARLGVVTARTLREGWRVALVAIAVLAAAITPSIDPLTMLLTMIPLLLLYLLSIGLAAVGGRQFARRVALDEAPPGA
ncbi:MAG: twin-arginine translocase subunit TatC [Candidatus Promineifilaceae bacterium]